MKKVKQVRPMSSKPKAALAERIAGLRHMVSHRSHVSSSFEIPNGIGFRSGSCTGYVYIREQFTTVEDLQASLNVVILVAEVVERTPALDEWMVDHNNVGTYGRIYLTKAVHNERVINSVALSHSTYVPVRRTDLCLIVDTLADRAQSFAEQLSKDFEAQVVLKLEA